MLTNKEIETGTTTAWINSETKRVQYTPCESCTPITETMDEVQAIPSEEINEWILEKLRELGL